VLSNRKHQNSIIVVQALVALWNIFDGDDRLRRRSTRKSFRSELKNRNFHSLTYVFHHVLVNMVISLYIFQLLASLVAFDLFAPLHNRILLYSFKHFYHRAMLLNLSCYSYLQLEGSIDIVVNSATLLPSIPPCRFTFKLTSYRAQTHLAPKRENVALHI
jgi:hypothetical protein